MTRSRSAALIAVSLLLIAAVLVLSRDRWLAGLGAALVTAEDPVSADVALVLAGDFYGHRILRAAELVRRGYVPKALVSGVAKQYGHYECDLAIPFAVAHGYPAEYFIPAPHDAHSTDEEAAVLLPVLRKMGVHRYLLVTSTYHTRRAGRLFRAQAPDLEVHVVAAPDENFNPRGWWHTREGRKCFLLEWEKTLAMAAGI